MSISSLRDALSRYLTNMQGYVDNHLPAILVSEQVTLSADSSETYDVASLIGESSDQYDLISTQIVVKILDETVGSVTEGHYINSEAVISHGTTPTGNVVIHNHSGDGVTLHVHIETPKKMGTGS